MTSDAAEGLSLRERKKRTTRDVLVRTALSMVDDDGFETTTLERLCEAAAVSKRTFFRYFAGKEDVLLAPGHDMWSAVLADLEVRDLDGGPLVDAFGAAVLASLPGPGDPEWTGQLRLSLRLAARHRSIEGQGLAFCDRTTAAMLESVRRRTGVDVDDDVRPRLCLDLVVSAVNLALRRWAARPGEPGAPDLADAVGHVLSELTEVPRWSVTSS